MPSAVQASGLPPVQTGDLIFHTSRSAQSLAVQRATGSPYSHMGVILLQDRQPCVLEAVQTVRCTPLANWIARGEGGHFVLKRLKAAPDAAAQAKLTRVAKSFAGRPYDLTFEWSDARIYCSELVWKLYERALDIRIGKLQQLRDFKLDDAAVRAKMRERYGEQVPLAEPVISPVAMFESELLVAVARR
ncbi:YiiX family permuted papain-like enzyme [Uliginosibacterium flavum]